MGVRKAALLGGGILLTGLILFGINRDRGQTGGSREISGPDLDAPEVQHPASPGGRNDPEGPGSARGAVDLQWLWNLDPSLSVTQAVGRLDDLLRLELQVERRDPPTLHALRHIVESGNDRARQVAALLLGRLKEADIQKALVKVLGDQTSAAIHFAILWAIGIRPFEGSETADERRKFWKDRLAQVGMGDGLPWSEAFEGQYDLKILETLELRARSAGSVVPHWGMDPQISTIESKETRRALLNYLPGAPSPQTKNLVLRLMNKQWGQDDCAEALARACLAEPQAGFADRYLEYLRRNETSEKVTALLLQYLTEVKNPKLRERALEALATKNTPGAQGYFLQMYLGAAEVQEKRLAIRGLGRFQDPAAYPILQRVVEQEGSAELRKTAAWMIARYSDASAGLLIRRIAAGDPDPGVRLEALRNAGDQGRLTRGDASFLQDLGERDSDEMVRSEAMKWLRKLSESPR